jgi:hypothetical protein
MAFSRGAVGARMTAPGGDESEGTGKKVGIRPSGAPEGGTLVGPKGAFSRVFGTFGRLISYSDKRTLWVRKKPIFYVELLTYWY